MAIEQKNVSKLFSLLSHHIRRDILFLLNEKGELSFTDFLTTLKLDTGTLSFHLRNLKNFLEQTPSGKYKLNKLGLNAVRLVKDFQTLSIEVEFTKKPSFFPVADTMKRAAAFLVDMGVIFAITVATSLVNGIAAVLAGNYFFDSNLVLFLVFLWIYSTLLEGFAGQTLGKRIFGLKVVNITGKKFSYDVAAVRNFGKCFLLPIDLIAGYWIMEKKYIKYFDKFTGAIVIDTSVKKSNYPNRKQP
ncbi:ArsR family transcriptional regulator [bacterium]|nr:MAG: ArsR family transcriptional regulator [bacterium]